MKIIPSKGKVLISEPFLNDINFKRTIILLVEHNEQGSIGFVLNKPTGYLLNEAVEEFPEIGSPLFYGGPVHVNSLHFIYRGEKILDDSVEVLPGLY
ncbi:MAG: YqgE/AlgH family protein, partial [Ignavibacteria bacterium]|nr:YqgE/AlgH family protein [Ignavibacteria bacterium]